MPVMHIRYAFWSHAKLKFFFHVGVRFSGDLAQYGSSPTWWIYLSQIRSILHLYPITNITNFQVSIYVCVYWFQLRWARFCCSVSVCLLVFSGDGDLWPSDCYHPLRLHRVCVPRPLHLRDVDQDVRARTTDLLRVGLQSFRLRGHLRLHLRGRLVHGEAGVIVRPLSAPRPPPTAHLQSDQVSRFFVINLFLIFKMNGWRGRARTKRSLLRRPWALPPDREIPVCRLPKWVILHISLFVWPRRTYWHQSHVSNSFWSKVIGKWQLTSGDLKWPFEG